MQVVREDRIVGQARHGVCLLCRHEIWSSRWPRLLCLILICAAGRVETFQFHIDARRYCTMGQL